VWFKNGDTVLMGGECGVWGCWPLTAKVEATASTVVWTKFRTGHRDRDLADLGPFQFDRAQYEPHFPSSFGPPPAVSPEGRDLFAPSAG
jgi:hypothetical protein